MVAKWFCHAGTGESGVLYVPRKLAQPAWIKERRASEAAFLIHARACTHCPQW